MENKFKGRALNANVVILPSEIKNETEAGLDISSIADKNEKYREGVVVAIGELAPKNEDGIPYVKVGDTIVFDKHKCSEFTQNGILYTNVYYADLFLLK